MSEPDPIHEQDSVFRGVMQHFFSAKAWQVSCGREDSEENRILFELNPELVKERHHSLERMVAGQKALVHDFTDFETSQTERPAPKDYKCQEQRTGLFLRLTTRLAGSRLCTATIFWSLKDNPQHIVLQREGILGFIRTMASLRISMSRMLLEKTAVEETLTKLAPACLILDRDRRVIFSNRAGARFKDKSNRTQKGGVLAPRFSTAFKAIFDQMFEYKAEGADASQDLSTKVFSIPLSEDSACPVFVSALPSIDLHLGGDSRTPDELFAVFVPQQESFPDAGVLEITLGLTPSEARLAEQIVRGKSVSFAAEALSIREHTARTYLKRIFSKLGVSRQSELGAAATRLHVPMEVPISPSGATAGVGLDTKG